MTPATDYSWLFEQATPRLYRRNAFFALGISIESSMRQVVRAAKKKSLQQQIEAERMSHGRPRPLIPENGEASKSPETPVTIQSESSADKAKSRLQDPVKRYFDSLFWFWPLSIGNAEEDEALQAITSGDWTKAQQLWLAAISEDATQTSATHNLALYHHIRALELDFSDSAGYQSKFSSKDHEFHWRRSLEYFQQVALDTKYPTWLEHLASSIDDPRLPTIANNKPADFFLGLVALISVKQAIALFQEGRSVPASGRLELLDDAAFSPPSVELAKSFALRPRREGLSRQVEQLRKRTEHEPKEALELSKQLRKDAEAELELIQRIAGENDVGLRAQQDEVAMALLDLAIAASNDLEAYETSIDLLNSAQVFAATKSISAKISDRIERARDQAKSSMRWQPPGFVDLPKFVQEKILEARRIARGGDWDSAVTMLKDLIQGRRDILSLEEVQLVYQSLATALSLRANQRLNSAFHTLQEPPSVFGKSPQPSTMERSARASGRYCAACGDSILFNNITFEMDGARFTLCPNCGSEAKREHENRTSRAKRLIRDAASDVLKALECDPGNSNLEEMLSGVKKLARQLGVQLPSRSSLSIPPPPEMDKSTARSTSRSTSEPPRRRTPTSAGRAFGFIGGLAFVALALFCLIILFASGSGSTGSNRTVDVERISETPQPTRTPQPTSTVAPIFSGIERFSSTTSSWQTGPMGDSELSIEDGRYTVRIPRNSIAWGTNSMEFEEGTIEVETYFIEGNSEEAFTSICIRCSPESGYHLLVNGSSSAFFVREDVDDLVELVPPRYYASVNNYWNQPNRWTLEVDGSRVVVSVNGMHLFEHSDSTYDDGLIYLGGIASSSQQAVFQFDNFEVRPLDD